jgi:TIR domain
VFISYGHGPDDGYVKRMARYLEAAGLRVWLDSAIVSGATWHKVIEERLSEATAVIVVMSPHSKRSSWVNREINYAEEHSIPIFPLLLSGDKFFRLSDLQFEDVRTERMPSKTLVERLQSIASNERTLASPPRHGNREGVNDQSATGTAEQIESLAKATESSEDDPDTAGTKMGATLLIGVFSPAAISSSGGLGPSLTTEFTIRNVGESAAQNVVIRKREKPFRNVSEAESMSQTSIPAGGLGTWSQHGLHVTTGEEIYVGWVEHSKPAFARCLISHGAVFCTAQRL